MTTFTWTISALDCYPQIETHENVVFNAHWRCTGTDTINNKTYTGSVYSTCQIQLDSETQFTPFNELTEEQVFNWIWTNGVNKEATENAVQSQIDNQINPPVITPTLPWNAVL